MAQICGGPFSPFVGAALTTTPRISVIIPTLNGEATLGELFGALKVQSCKPSEVLVIDSSSCDRTAELARDFGAKLLTIERNQFDHGGTRTVAAQQSTCEILVFFTQDAVLADRHALQRLVAPLLTDPTVACTYGRQLPAKDADPIAAHLRLFNYPPLSQCRCFADRSRYGLKTVFISNSFAAYRKSALSSCGFFKNGLIFGEDTCTLGRLLEAGYRVCYVAEAEVYHSHNYSLLQDFRRAFDIGVLHRREAWLLDAYGRAEGVGGQYVRSLLAAMVQMKRYVLLVDCLVRITLKFLGYQLGRQYPLLPARLLPLLSMNSIWWQRDGAEMTYQRL